MAQSKHQIQAILRGAGGRPRRPFGQNFMIDANLVRLVAQAGELAPGELAIEVGPGTGTLTEELLATGAQVLAVEIDRDLAAILRQQFAAEDRFRLIEGDALAGKHALNNELLDAIFSTRKAGPGGKGRVKLVANLPYNIASPLVIELLIAGVDLLALVVQREVALRLAARPGTPDYGPLTVMAQLLSQVQILRRIPPEAFWPAPKVDSALVRMVRQDLLAEAAADFSAFIHRLFASRRKTLRKAMELAGVEGAGPLEKLGIDPKQRAEELSPQMLLRIFRELPGQSGLQPPMNTDARQ